MPLKPGKSFCFSSLPDRRLQVLAIKAQLLQGGDAVLLVVILGEGGDGGAQHLQGEGGHGLGWGLHAFYDSLELLVCEGGLVIVSLNDPGILDY